MRTWDWWGAFRFWMGAATASALILFARYEWWMVAISITIYALLMARIWRDS